ncbi:hypothetical protein C8Q80DRAFT_255647 [Daedaleopsis nitida]|nr:hypothetical protein C8Q80DRAFT_255647 [Daedaleopsis nitida]
MRTRSYYQGFLHATHGMTLLCFVLPPTVAANTPDWMATIEATVWSVPESIALVILNARGHLDEPDDAGQQDVVDVATRNSPPQRSTERHAGSCRSGRKR